MTLRNPEHPTLIGMCVIVELAISKMAPGVGKQLRVHLANRWHPGVVSGQSRSAGRGSLWELSVEKNLHLQLCL